MRRMLFGRAVRSVLLTYAELLYAGRAAALHCAMGVAKPLLYSKIRFYLCIRKVRVLCSCVRRVARPSWPSHDFTFHRSCTNLSLTFQVYVP